MQFKIIAVVFWLWYGSCLLAMYYQIEIQPVYLKALTTSSIAFLSIATLLVCFIKQDCNQKYMGICIASIIVVYIFIIFNYFGIIPNIREKLVCMAIVTVGLFMFINKLIK